jgi:tight adherence protein C
MQLYFLLGVVFVTLCTAFIGLFLWLRKRHHPTARRIKELAKDPMLAETEDSAEREEKEPLKAHFGKVLADLSRFSRQNEEKVSKLRKKLIQAGYYKEESVRTFIGFRVMTAISFFCVFLYLGSLGDRSLFLVFILSAFVAWIGSKIPESVLNFRIRKRQAGITSGLPDALDLLVITMEAGLGLNAALVRVSEDLGLRCRALAEEFGRVNQDLRTGLSREDALRRLSERNQVEDLRIFVGALILADQLGTSIADTLRAQADSLRTRIYQRAEERAAKAGIKMLFPLVMFILPALFIILMGPAIISLIQTFRS